MLTGFNTSKCYTQKRSGIKLPVAGSRWANRLNNSLNDVPPFLPNAVGLNCFFYFLADATNIDLCLQSPDRTVMLC